MPSFPVTSDPQKILYKSLENGWPPTPVKEYLKTGIPLVLDFPISVSQIDNSGIPSIALKQLRISLQLLDSNSSTETS